MEGTFKLQISKETVPDFATAKIDCFNNCDFIFSSLTVLQFSKPCAAILF